MSTSKKAAAKAEKAAKKVTLKKAAEKAKAGKKKGRRSGKAAGKDSRTAESARTDAAFTAPLAELLRPAPGFSVGGLDASSTPGWDDGRAAAEVLTAELGQELSELQERLFAQGRAGGTRSVLLVLQGLDTSGKGGIVRHVLGMVDPQGVSIRSFGVPSEEERSHHYLWRIRQALPAPGRIGVFDRSHYEDVLVVKVDRLADEAEIEGRYDEIVQFERELVEAGTTVVKVALVISPDEQFARLRERLERTDKQWKFSMGDLRTRAQWPAYTDAYDTVLARTSSEHAPWHVVPANRKWYSRLAITSLLVESLRELELDWPPATFDVDQALAALDVSREDPTALSVEQVEERRAAVEGATRD